MSDAAKRTRATGKGKGATFFALPHHILDHQGYLELSYTAKSLLIELGRQFNGKNNGDLTCAWGTMKNRNWKSKSTLNNARVALIDAGFIVQTRVGFYPSTASLYAFTWLGINECNGKLDVSANPVPSNLWKTVGQQTKQA